MSADFGIIINVVIVGHNEPLAQLAEHLTFNQRVWGSNPQWLTSIKSLKSDL